MLADQHGEGMEFVVLEKAAVPVKDYIYEVSLMVQLNKLTTFFHDFIKLSLTELIEQVEGVHRKYRAANISLQMLKGIHDLHAQGIQKMYSEIHYRYSYRNRNLKEVKIKVCSLLLQSEKIL